MRKFATGISSSSSNTTSGVVIDIVSPSFALLIASSSPASFDEIKISPSTSCNRLRVASPKNKIQNGDFMTLVSSIGPA